MARVVVSEASAKEHITTNPEKYIKAFETFITDDYSKRLWETFEDDQKSDYIRWFFNKDDSIYGTYEKLNEHGLLTLLDSNSDARAKYIFLARFPDKQPNPDNPDNPNDNTTMTAFNVFNKTRDSSGGSRRRRQRTRKYKKSKRIFRSKKRQTRRR
jgi:hypothetical protein